MFSSDKKVSAFYTRPTSSTAAAEDKSKSSYYVWFLGSRESKGLRGAEYIRPVVKHLLERNADVKLTLQVSQKGLKIVHPPDKSKKRSSDAGSNTSSSDNSKQFVPHSSITCVMQSEAPNDDVVSCILLVSTPGSDCPLFVHSYRCDSAETASLLRQQLQALVDKPENQAKYTEIESRLVEKGLLPTRNSNGKFVRAGSSHSSAGGSKLGSDGRSLGRSSDSGGSELNPSGPPDKLVTLYDSLAAELREKLNNPQNKHPPLLLPPRDYDTMHRAHGNLNGVERRKALNPAIVGKLAAKKGGSTANNVNGTSDGSSGIGSDEAPSPTRGNRESSPQLNEQRFSSDEDWQEHNREEDDEEDEEEAEDSPRPLVSIQPYTERSGGPAAKPLSTRYQPKKMVPEEKVEVAASQEKKEMLGRKNSFQEIQRKFQSMEKRQPTVRDDVVRLKPSEMKSIQQKLEKVLNNKKEPTDDMVEDKHKDAGYVSREKSRTREEKSPQDSINTTKKLESYLSRHKSKEDEFDSAAAMAAAAAALHKEKQQQKAKVKRQASKCSSILSPPYSRNMEAVGEFEKVWSWADSNGKSNNVPDVPLTRELSPEYRKRGDRSGSPGRRGRGPVSPTGGRGSRQRSPDSNHKSGSHHQRGMSSPPEMRRSRDRAMSPTRGGPHPAFFAAHGQPPPHMRRRAMSPEVLRRSSSRGGALSPDPVRILRREKTSVFDNRYPSLDFRSDKRKTLYELQEDVHRNDMRRRSYHELSNPELLQGPPMPHPLPVSHHNFQHSGKKSKESSKKRYPPGGPPPHHLMQMGPPPPWADPRGFFPGPQMAPHPHGPPPHMHHPHGRHGHGPHPPPMGRFGIAPMRHY